jgi:ferredoxin--NADP+ reductase
MATNTEDEIRVPDVALNIYKPKNPVEVKIVKSEIVTSSASPNFVRHVEFDVSGTELEGNVLPGQALGVLAEGEDERGRPHKVRLYSTSSPTGGEDGEGKIYSTTVKRVIDEHWDNHSLFTGVCSNYLCNLEVGDTLMMTGPSGRRFLLPEKKEDYNYVFLATGTGIAPFRGMIMDLINEKAPSEMALAFGCPYRTDLLYQKTFEAYDEANDNFHYLPFVSREDPRPDGTKPYVQYSLLDRKELMMPILEKENTLIYVCGLKGMETGIFQILGQLGLYDYIELKDELKDVDPLDWTRDQVSKLVKPGNRMFLEVY